MSERFVRQLEELHVELITMGSLCEKAISLSAKAIQGEGGMTLIGKIFETEKEIDAQEKEIENPFFETFKVQKPIISASAKLNDTKVNNTLLYDFPTEKGKIYTLISK